MIHAYNEYLLDLAQSKLGSMFEIAHYHLGLTVDEFANAFIHSHVCAAFESGDPVYLAGKSANELLAIALDKPAEETEQSMQASPEYWVGWVLAYTQWYLNKPFSEIITAYPCEKLLLNYFPYHETDPSETVKLIERHLPTISALKAWRQKRGLSQSELAQISEVPLRTIKAYEQGTSDITKAQVETLYKLATTLNCTIETLIK